MDISGAFRVEGKVKTRRLEARLHNSKSRVGRGIEAERVDIRPHERGFGHRMGELTTTKILGVQEVSLENVECDEVFGGRVTIGEGCTVRGRVLYTESIEVHPHAHVAGTPEKAERLPP
ncbi:MAG: hypothetical protein JRI84_15190 [Deltaproteobacteria bacterium]|nr:hypothetical protein [Deltaproteobacteria bacterium]